MKGKSKKVRNKKTKMKIKCIQFLYKDGLTTFCNKLLKNWSKSGFCSRIFFNAAVNKRKNKKRDEEKEKSRKKGKDEIIDWSHESMIFGIFW